MATEMRTRFGWPSLALAGAAAGIAFAPGRPRRANRILRTASAAGLAGYALILSTMSLSITPQAIETRFGFGRLMLRLARDPSNEPALRFFSYAGRPFVLAPLPAMPGVQERRGTIA